MSFYKKEVCPLCNKQVFVLIRCSKCELKICGKCATSDWEHFPLVICDKCLTNLPKEDTIP